MFVHERTSPGAASVTPANNALPPGRSGGGAVAICVDRGGNARADKPARAQGRDGDAPCGCRWVSPFGMRGMRAAALASALSRVVHGAGPVRKEPTMTKRVRDLLKRHPITLESETPVVEAARAMQTANVGAVIVTDQGRLVGILTDRDIAVRVVAHGDDPNTTRIADVCSMVLATLSPDDELERAFEIMQRKAVRRMPVVDANRLAVGILSLGDLMLERNAPSVLGEIDAARPH